MNPIVNLSIYCVIAFALLGSMIFMLLTSDKNDKTSDYQLERAIELIRSISLYESIKKAS